MSEYTYYIDRGFHGDVTLWRENEPNDKYPLAVTIDSELIDLLRSLGVEDRTQPDWSDVEPGTAGTATVRGVRGVRVLRRQGALDPDELRWASATDVVVGDASFYHRDGQVTAFEPDVVVDRALFGAVGDAIINTSLTETDKRIAISAAHRALRGES